MNAKTEKYGRYSHPYAAAADNYIKIIFGGILFRLDLLKEVFLLHRKLSQVDKLIFPNISKNLP